MSQVYHPKYYIDLDSLLDTRAGLLSLNHPADLQAALPTWRTRTHEKFGSISCKAWHELWKKRDRKLLTHSSVTKWLDEVYLFGVSCVMGSAARFSKIMPKVEVNTYPYVLTEKEKADMLTALNIRLNGLVTPSLIHVSPAELSPRTCQSKYVEMTMYNWVQWLDVQEAKKGFEQVNMVRVPINLPRVYFNDEMTPEEFLAKRQSGIEADIFETLEVSLAGCLQLHWVDISTWCFSTRSSSPPADHPSQEADDPSGSDPAPAQ